jgi:glycosyltransferase involved in cell wall biosynthesis
MKVEIVYRNYKHLHDLYASLRITPPAGVRYFIAEPKKYLHYFLPIHRKFGSMSAVRFFINKWQDLLFKSPQPNVDLYHLAQIIPKDIPDIPRVVDFEHISAINGFAGFDEQTTREIFRFLADPKTFKIMPFSSAAEDSLKYLLQDNYERISDKIEVVYPALPAYALSEKPDYMYVNANQNVFKLLFVGNGIKRKGLLELLLAFKQLEVKHDNIELYIVSNAPKRVIREYTSTRIKFFQPKFSHKKIIRQLYLPCDLFVLPTHSDSFGMALLYSLACGTPVLTTKQFAAPEIVNSGRTGLFVDADQFYLEKFSLPSRESWNRYKRNMKIDKKIVDQLVGKIENLYFNRDLVGKMGQRAVNDFEPGGKFSIGVRNRKLGRIYKECLEH